MTFVPSNVGLPALGKTNFKGTNTVGFVVVFAPSKRPFPRC
jgi:hypothetical protein